MHPSAELAAFYVYMHVWVIITSIAKEYFFLCTKFLNIVMEKISHMLPITTSPHLQTLAEMIKNFQVV